VDFHPLQGVEGVARLHPSKILSFKVSRTNESSFTSKAQSARFNPLLPGLYSATISLLTISEDKFYEYVSDDFDDDDGLTIEESSSILLQPKVYFFNYIE